MSRAPTSDRRRRANQANAKMSTGPKSSAGKARSSRNALRHGLNSSIWSDPELAPEADAIARRIAGSEATETRLELARRIGAAQLDISRVRTMRHSLILKSMAEHSLQGEEILSLILDDKASELTRLDRYERRALSRRKFAIREFDAFERGEK